MSSARLVTLSACETGITDIKTGSSDEFVGLPAGFMLAGVPCVVSSLWSVPDISTAILMERFYPIILFWEWRFPKLYRMLNSRFEI
jgi:CHAT domain-containing protein